MYQIDNSSVADTQPVSTPAGTAGFFTDGNPATGVAATVVPAEFLNSVMLELLGILQAAGVQPDKTKSNQVASAINSIVQGGAKTYTLDTGTANAYAAAYSPAITALPDGIILHFLAKTACAGASTLKVDGMPVKPLLNNRHAPTKPGQISIGSLCTVQYVVTLDSFVLLGVTGAAVPSTIAGYGITDAYTSAQIDALLGAQTRVVSAPTISGSSSVTTGTVVALTATASALLAGATIASFTWTLPDGTSNTTAASSGSATRSVTAVGSIGTNYVVKVMATDNAGNTSQVATKSIAITNHSAPTTPTTITVAATVYQNSTGNAITVSGSTASDGATITYSLSQSGPVAVTFSKATGIAAGEQVTFSAPPVAADTPVSISVVAVDSMGGVSAVKTVSVTVAAFPTSAGAAFGGGYYAGANIVINGVEYALISAPASLGGETTGFVRWKTTNTPTTPTTTSVTDGIANWAAILAAGIVNFPAAAFCTGLSIGGYTDWRLPSLAELEIIYRYLKGPQTTNWVQNNISGNPNGVNPVSRPVGTAYTTTTPGRTAVPGYIVGGPEAFKNNIYWSSSQGIGGINVSSPWYLGFDNGGQGSSSSADNPIALVRAVRLVRVSP